MINLQTILCPTDFSENANHARPYAIELAKKFGAKVILMHVVPYPFFPKGYEINLDLPSILEDLTNTNQKALDKIAAGVAKDGIKVETKCATGTPFVEIIRTARHESVGLIVIATHGYGPVKHLLLGSTAERVVRKAPCPVLIVRDPEREFVMP